MNKILILVLVLFNSLFSSEDYELKLYETVLPIIFNTTEIKVFVTKDINTILKSSDKFIIVNNCNDADLLIGKKFINLPNNCKDKPLFTTTYKSFKNNVNCIGAFYWKKGRPQIKFKLKNIEKHNLLFPLQLWKYAK